MLHVFSVQYKRQEATSAAASVWKVLIILTLYQLELLLLPPPSDAFRHGKCTPVAVIAAPPHTWANLTCSRVFSLPVLFCLVAGFSYDSSPSSDSCQILWKYWDFPLLCCRMFLYLYLSYEVNEWMQLLGVSKCVRSCRLSVEGSYIGWWDSLKLVDKV